MPILFAPSPTRGGDLLRLFWSIGDKEPRKRLLSLKLQLSNFTGMPLDTPGCSECDPRRVWSNPVGRDSLGRLGNLGAFRICINYF